MLVFIRCNDIVSDSRSKKYISFYSRNNIDYKIIAWDRLGNSEKLPNTIYCPYRSKYEQGGIRAIIDRLKWMWFIFRTLWTMNDNLHIHACDLDAAFPAAIYKIVSHRKTFMLFDVFDWISDTLYNQGKIVLMAFSFMEWLSVKKSDHLIICEPERVHQIPYNIEGRYSVLQNIPSFQSSEFLIEDKKYHFDNDLLTLCYVGGFTQDRCLKELVDGAIAGNYNLNIAGYGWKELTEQLETNKENPCIHYFGKVKYKDGLCLMYNSDLIYAMYSKTNPNHIFAAPNKYYEAMFVGKPLITTNGIIIADKVKENEFGYGIDENLESLLNLLSGITLEELKNKENKATRLWDLYKSKTEDYLKAKYTKLMF